MRTPHTDQRPEQQVRDLSRAGAAGERSGEQSDLGGYLESPLWNAEQLAAFLHRAPGGVKKSAQRGELPVAAKTKRPWTWSAAEWLRWKDSARTYV
jgi:hypothetical protein